MLYGDCRSMQGTDMVQLIWARIEMIKICVGGGQPYGVYSQNNEVLMDKISKMSP